MSSRLPFAASLAAGLSPVSVGASAVSATLKADLSSQYTSFAVEGYQHDDPSNFGRLRAAATIPHVDFNVDVDVHMHDFNAKSCPVPCHPVNDASSVNVPPPFLPPSMPHAAYVASDYAVLTDDAKTELMHSLIRNQLLKGTPLRKLAALHVGISGSVSHERKAKTASAMVSDFLAHRCTMFCLIGLDIVRLGGLSAPVLTADAFSTCAKVLKLRRVVPVRKRKEGWDTDPVPAKRARLEPPPDRDAAHNEPLMDQFRVLAWEEKLEILAEYHHATSNAALRRLECSFCGVLELITLTDCIPCAQLDITLLQTAVAHLRDICNQPNIQAFNPATVKDGCYVLCSSCRQEVAHFSFNCIPLRAYANGLWTGPCPEELQDLTFLEEQCIARARATRCMFKLELGPGGQFASRGNVCVLPQDPGPLATVLPPPINQLRDEVCVVLVGSPLTVITPSMLDKTPLLVRRSRIVRALLWLKENNPLYADLNVESIHQNAKTYPEHGIPLAVSEFMRTESTSEGSSYTDQANTEAFSNVGLIGMPSSTVVDADSIDATYQQRKLAALQLLKTRNKPYLKFPSGSTPLSTINNPRLYGQLWPTLFPYGVGMMEYHEIALSQDVAFRKIDTRTHVAHLLRRGADRRFQRHLSFIFVMGNLMQRRQSAFNSKLAVKRAWFPQVNVLYQEIDDSTITSYREKLQKNPFAKPESPGEKSAAKLMQYVSYVAENVPGSTAEIQKMRQEMFSIIQTEGLPHVFLTLNPTDTNNPVAQFLAGRDIDLDKFFDDLDAGKENQTRASTIGHDPIAGAKFFHLSVRNLVDILLGTKRKDGVGVYGKVSTYYGVIESQGHGRLHIHMLIWLKDGCSPLELSELCKDPEFAKKVFVWYKDVFSHSIPEDTHAFDRASASYLRQPVMSRPPNPRDPQFSSQFNQDLRDVIESTAQIHEHSDTCFKYLLKTLRNFKDNDKDCRFQLPQDTVQDTHMNEDGKIILKCNNGRVNPYTPLIAVSQRCNMDSKAVGSGTMALAMVEYTGNYTIKGAMDTAFVFSALCAGIKAISESPPKNIEGGIDTAEHSRLLMVKTVNQLIGKRELSSQQMATRLLGLPMKYTNRRFPVFYWSKMLREVAPQIFRLSQEPEPDSESVTIQPDTGDVDANDSEGQFLQKTLEEIQEESMVVLTEDALNFDAIDNELELSQRSALFNDIFYRPPELNDVCAWNIFVQFDKRPLPKSKTQTKEFLRYAPGHPQYTTHCLKRISENEDPRVPVLCGVMFPRADRDDQADRYAVAVLSLFKPWSLNKESPLKPPDISWQDAYTNLDTSLSPDLKKIVANCQLRHQTRDAKEDYSAMRRQRKADLAREFEGSSFTGYENESDEYDPVWENAMQSSVDILDTEEADFTSALSVDCSLIVDATTASGFYLSEAVIPCAHSQGSRPAGAQDFHLAEKSMSDLQTRREALISARFEKAIEEDTKDSRNRSASDIVPPPTSSSLVKERELAEILQHLFGNRLGDSPSPSGLEAWQEIAVALTRKHSLNDMQILAYLLLVDVVGRQSDSEEPLDAFRMLVTGPGGTGKTRIFEAWTDFHEWLHVTEQLHLTGPTGVVASDIGGSTIHSEASLVVKRENMKSTNPRGQKIRSALEQRLAPVRTLVVDEIYFLGASDMSILSEYCSIAKGITDSPFGRMNLVTCGDPCQLPPPGSKSLFDRELVRCFKSQNLNAGNETTQYNIKGIQAWHQVNHVVVLSEIMRQKGDAALVELLGRLRKGVCTQTDKDLLDCYVLSNEQCSAETRDLTKVVHWLEGRGCPLITYKNEARDAHNFEMAKAFALATGQEPAIYYASDTRGRGKKKYELQGIAAEAAWHVPVKQSNDLGGRIPYIPGMPVFCTQNIATELGLSKGSPGTLVSIKYTERNGRRYAVCAEVDFPGYRSSDEEHPHRVLLKPVCDSFKFKLPGAQTQYTANRTQLPLIPAFAFTSHNSQGRTLDYACVDLSSCRSIQSAYVMLSRLRSLKGLCILRPFSLNKIQNHISEELRQELARTEELAQHTLRLAQSRLAWFYNRYPSTIFDNLP